MKTRYSLLFSITLVLLFAGCKTTARSPSSHFVYSIQNAELCGNTVSFSFKNCSTCPIKKIRVYVKLGITDQDSDYCEIPAVEKDFSCFLDSLETETFSFTIEDFEAETVCEGFQELLMNDAVYIQRIYSKEIVFENDLLWYDKYGNWNF